MKNVLKKLLIIFLIFLTINTFVISNTSYAKDLLETIGEGIVGIFAYPVQLLLKLGGTAINWVTAGVAYIDGKASDKVNEKTLTPFNILFNDVKLVNVNVFDLSEPNTIVGKIRGGIATWYYVLRILASAILLVILVYVGIRMAITTIASDKAMYSKMLIDWVTSLALIFLLQYIILFTFYVNDALVDAMKAASGDQNVDTAIETIGNNAYAFGYKGIGAAAVYFILVTQTIGLLISYINRMLKVSFLIIISPLITLTYSIDKMGDGKAQALGTWLKEFVFTVLMQPFHCIIYMVMVSTALDLLATNDTGLGHAILAIVCIRFIQEAEKIVRKIFHFEDDNSGTSVAAGMAMSAMMLSQSKNIGKTLKSGVTTAKNLKANTANLLRHAKTDAMVMGAVLTKNNKTDIQRAKVDENGEVVKDDQGNTVMETVGQRKMTYAELKEEALAKQIDKKADKLGKKVYGNIAGDSAYSNYTGLKRDDLKDDKERARYDTLRNSGMGHTRAMATLRKEKLEKEKEKHDKENPTLKTRAISGYKSAKNAVHGFNQLDIVKDFKAIGNAYISTAVGAGVGLAMYGNGRDFMQSSMMGAAAFGSTQEFMKDTTKNLVTTAAQSVAALNAASPEEARAMTIDALQSDPSRFQENSDEINQILDNLKNQLKALGMNETAINKFSNRIHKEVRKNALKGNPESITDIMAKNLDQYNDSQEGRAQPINYKDKDTTLLKDALFQTSDFENKKIIFENFQKATEATGISADAYTDEVVGNYKSNSESSFGDVASGTPERVDITDETVERIKDQNDKVDIDDAEARTREVVEDISKKVLETSLDQSEKDSIKQEVERELTSRLEKEIKDQMEKIQQSADKDVTGIKNDLLEQKAQFEKEKARLEQMQKQLDEQTRTMSSAERHNFEKEKLINEYNIQYTSQMITYSMNYNRPKNPNTNK